MKTPIHLPHDILSGPTFTNNEVYWAKNVVLDQMPNDPDFSGTNGKLTMRVDQVFTEREPSGMIPLNAYSVSVTPGHGFGIGLAEGYHGGNPSVESTKTDALLVQKVTDSGTFPYRTVITVTQQGLDIIGIQIEIPDHSQLPIQRRQKICVLDQTPDHFGMPRIE